MSNNNLSSGELFICKVATEKHHITSALFKCSPTNAEVRESDEIPENSRTEGSQVHFKTRCFENSPCLGWSMATLNEVSFMMVDTNPVQINGSSTRTCLIWWFLFLRGFWYIWTQSISLWKKKGITGWKSKNTCIQLGHVHVFWEHNIQFGNLLSSNACYHW